MDCKGGGEKNSYLLPPMQKPHLEQSTQKEGEEMKNLSWQKYTTLKETEDIEEISPVRCILGAAGILMVGVLGYVLVVVGLSL